MSPSNENCFFKTSYKIRPFKEAFIIMSIYGIFGTLWIWLSDSILAYLIPNAEKYREFQTYKGWLYVFLTMFLIYGLVKSRTNITKKYTEKLEFTHKDLENTYNNLLIAEEKLKNTVYFDSLTGVHSRLSLENKTEELIEKNMNFRFFHINFDNFKYINDTLGLKEGDLFLKDMSRRLKDYIKRPNIVSRFGGDEFGLLIVDSDLVLTHNKLSDILGEKWKTKGHEFFINVSVGVAFYPKDGSQNFDVFRNASLALAKAKKEGKGREVFYSGDFFVDNSEKIKIANDLQQITEKNELFLYYQPQIDLNSGNIKGFEALIRWISPTKGFIPPDIFIPIAEEIGQIYTIEKWVLKTALNQKLEFEKMGLSHLDLSINLSSKTLMSTINFQEMENIFSSYDLDYSHITLEVTETAIISDMDLAISRLESLKKYGLKIALDDFGTGYSSLTHLKKLPIDVIKLDKSFVNSISKNNIDTSIIKYVLYLADDINFEVVAEGIETKEQYLFLEKNRCKSGQGYLMSKAQPIEVIYSILEENYKTKLFI